VLYFARVNATDTEGHAPHVLVVDDDPNIRRMMVAALKRDGYTFAEAANGREALDSMRADKPDVVVLDLMMPVMSGWDVLQEREHDATLRQNPVMTRNVAELLREAESLSEADRAELAGRILETLHGEPEEDVEAAWAEEIERRVRQLDAGEVKTIPWEEVRAKMHALLHEKGLKAIPSTSRSRFG
jgi:putative addiction module component (TIGR02574 family)